ncbi:hypothetical protein F2P81_014740 [Scophthalmus maximus]|uniref:Uncharacterized protein n=1 Tax=Scophthalmus maximus TaxID=52904 RepID=A0A6A4SKS8_SCOMX|nr:hypothetical protein F2P81_014740 [Scophthalmus maximus]
MIVELLKQQGTLHSSSDLLKIPEKIGGQLVDFQAGKGHAVRAWNLPGLLSVKELFHILFTDPECRPPPWHDEAFGVLQ